MFICCETVKRVGILRIPSKVIIFLFLSSKVPLDVPLYAVGRLSTILHLFNAPEKSKQRFALSAKALFFMCEYHVSYVSG